MLPTQPTLQELKARMLADLDYRLPSLRLRPAKSVLVVLATVLAGAVSSLYAFAGWIAQQLDPLTASEAWLSVWAARLGCPRKEATASSGSVSFTGAADIPIGTRLRHAVTGLPYRTAGLLAAGVCPVVAETAGAAGNLLAPSSLTLETPIAGVSMTATLATDLAGGADQETLPAWAARVAEKLQERQKIGDADDYRRWAKESHPAIADAIVEGNTPLLGDIRITVLGTAAAPVVDAIVLAAAQANLDRKRNMGCTVRLQSALSLPIAIRIADVAAVDQAAIEAAIRNLFVSRAKFGAQIWPEEIERILELYTPTYTLLSPVSKVTAPAGGILAYGGVAWL